MMFMTYPDGTKELHDGGLMIRVQEGKVVAGALTLTHDAEPYEIQVEGGADPRAMDYRWQKQVGQKWVDQLNGTQALMTESGPVWWPATSVPDVIHAVAS